MCRLPEPAGRTYAELDELFERKVPARKFRKTRVEVFRQEDGRTEERKFGGGKVE